MPLYQVSIESPKPAAETFAYLAAFAWGSEHGYRVLVEMDADGSHRPEDLRRLLDALTADVDVVLGSRWIRGGSVVDWPRSREILSRGGNAYARIMLGLGLHDATAGFRLYRASLLRRMQLDAVASKGYCFQVDMARRAVEGNETTVGREQHRVVTKRTEWLHTGERDLPPPRPGAQHHRSGLHAGRASTSLVR